MNHDLLADVFSAIKNTEGMGRPTAVVPASTLAENVLKIMQKRQYIGEFTSLKRQRKFEVHLLGRVNDCNVSKPRFSIKNDEYIKWEKRFLPANGIGILILSTPKGVMDHQEAKKLGIGGQILGYVY
ncbi:MAG: 30S ribosomal protein S8 [Candidatus Aenigmarchaeota archaeon]|nr:30S ribosomal protein S8 [Candidatus Aenigmarchaeota archaeon]